MVILPGHFVCEEEFEGWLPRMTFEKYSSHFFLLAAERLEGSSLSPNKKSTGFLSSGLFERVLKVLGKTQT